MSKKKSFVFYYDWRDILEPFDNENIGILLRAILKYAVEESETDFEDLALKIAFNFIKNTLKRDKEKYHKICADRAEYGKMAKNIKDSRSISKHKQGCENDNDIDIDIDIDNENDNEKIISSSFSKKTACAYSEDFLLFWKEYPKKVGKGEAFRQWTKSHLTRADASDILNALKWQKHSSAWCNSSGRFIPNPSTYISQRRWEDEPTDKVRTDITSPQSYNDGDDLPEFIMKGELQ